VKKYGSGLFLLAVSEREPEPPLIQLHWLQQALPEVMLCHEELKKDKICSPVSLQPIKPD